MIKLTINIHPYFLLIFFSPLLKPRIIPQCLINSYPNCRPNEFTGQIFHQRNKKKNWQINVIFFCFLISLFVVLIKIIKVIPIWQRSFGFPISRRQFLMWFSRTTLIVNFWEFNNYPIGRELNLHTQRLWIFTAKQNCQISLFSQYLHKIIKKFILLFSSWLW